MRCLSDRLKTTLFALAIPALGAAGCGSTTDTTTTPTTSTGTTQVLEGFTMTVSPAGASTVTFITTAAGTVNASVKSIAPTTTAVLGIALGTWNGSNCQVVIANDNATTSSTVVGGTSAAGNLCIRAYDVGRLTAAQTLEITVIHY